METLNKTNDIMKTIFKKSSGVSAVQSEEQLHRLVLEYESVNAVVTCPMILHRRTGQILKTNAAFAELISIPMQDLAQKSSFYEVASEETVSNFYDRMLSLISDGEQKAVITGCLLISGGRRSQAKSPSHNNSGIKNLVDPQPDLIPCTMSSIIRRDSQGIPILIVTSFVPMEYSLN